MHCLIISLTVTLKDRYFNDLASLYLRTEIIRFPWTFPGPIGINQEMKNGLLVPFCSWSSPFSLVGKATYLLPLAPLYLAFWCWGRKRPPHHHHQVPVAVAHCIHRGHMSHLYCACITVQILGGIRTYLMSFTCHLSGNRQQLHFLAAVNFAGEAIHKADHVHSMNCFSLPLHV